MPDVECIVTKPWGGHAPGDVVRLSEEDLPRFVRKGRVRVVKREIVDRLKLRPPPPALTESVPVSSFRRKLVFPDVTPGERPDRDNSETPPPKREPAPNETKPEGPDKDKRLPAPDVQLIPAGHNWWHVKINGVPVTKDDGSTRNFRRQQAESYRDEYLELFTEDVD